MRRLSYSLTMFLVALAVIAGVTVVLSARGRAGAQIVTGAPKGGHVTFIADGQSVAAGRPATLALHFRVDPGFHINSHVPKSDMLIPTKILVEDMNGAEVSDVSFPAGTPYSFAFEPNTKLDVYTGDVTLTAHVKAKPGTYTLKAALHYQACDQAACYPPKTLAIEQPFSAK